MIAEDETISLEYLAMSLAVVYPEATIYKALDGRAGLDIFILHKPEIVISDYRMPEMNGREMVDRIQSIKGDTKFIVLTGDYHNCEIGGSDRSKVTINHFIEKPVDLDDLIAAVDQCIREIQNDLPELTQA